MPEFSLHLPRFLRFNRSRHSNAPKPPHTGLQDDAGSSHSSCLGTLEQDLIAVTGTSCPSPPLHLQISTGRLHVDKALNDFSGQPSQSSQLVTQIVNSKSTPTASPHDSATQQPGYLSPLPIHIDPIQPLHPVAWRRSPHLIQTSSQRPSDSQGLTQSSSECLPRPQYQKQGMLNHARDFSAMGNFIDISGNVGNVSLTSNVHTSNQFMEKLLKETIPGAAFDSSDRYPPPRCHPGTRLAILERCLHFIIHCNGEKKMCWVVGAAGVGKSAIMQNVAESPKLPGTCQASVFFSINGRNDGTRAIMTLSYQLAAKSKAYRHFIEDEITRDPSLLRSSMPVQFKKFIIEPFIHNTYLNTAGRVLITIDGLDECNNSRNQLELLHLISNLCISYPSSPLVWLVASRPETHIISFFSRAEVMPIYEKEEIQVDSDEARADVERFLRDELTEIKKTSDLLDPQWPDEKDLWKLANAAGGLFAYADTAVKYIGDSTIGSPASQLSDVLNVIDNHPMTDVPREEHPMALLDALYARILSNVPSKIMMNTRKLLLALAPIMNVVYDEGNFVVLCNWLHMTPDEAYAAVNHLRSVLLVPRRDKAHEEKFEPFHKSFIDYVSDFTRSGFSPDIHYEARQIKTQCSFRIIKEAPDGFDFSDENNTSYHGILARNSGTSDKISLTWPADKGTGWSDHEMRSRMYKLAIGQVAAGMERGDPVFRNELCIRLLSTRFQQYYGVFPHYALRDYVFNGSWRHEFMMLGILKQIPLKAVGISEKNTHREVKLQFHCPVTMTTLPHPWDPSREDEPESLCKPGKDQNWITTFYLHESLYSCKRLDRQLESWIIRSPDLPVAIMFTSTGSCCVEVRFVDLEDGVSEWTYWLWINLSLEEREKLGSAI